MKDSPRRHALVAAFLSAMLLSAQPASAVVESGCDRDAASVAFWIDVSGSMLQDAAATAFPKELKLPLAGRLVQETWAAASGRNGFMLSVSTLAPYTRILPLGKVSSEELSTAIDRLNPTLEVFGRPTRIGERAIHAAADEREQPDVLVFLTDGLFPETAASGGEAGRTPHDLLRTYREHHRGTEIRIVSAAGLPEEEKAAANLAADVRVPLARLGDILSTPEATRTFIGQLLRKECPSPAVARLELQGINFEFDKATLTKESTEILNRALDIIRTRPEEEDIRIDGWTDSVGSDAYNLALSRRRAESVLEFFIAGGIDPKRLSATGRGKSFKYDNASRQGRWKNRRVELLFTNGRQP